MDVFGLRQRLVYRINLGWSNHEESQPRGFNLDLERGYWSRN